MTLSLIPGNALCRLSGSEPAREAPSGCNFTAADAQTEDVTFPLTCGKTAYLHIYSPYIPDAADIFFLKLLFFSGNV